MSEWFNLGMGMNEKKLICADFQTFVSGSSFVSFLEYPAVFQAKQRTGLKFAQYFNSIIPVIFSQ